MLSAQSWALISELTKDFGSWLGPQRDHKFLTHTHTHTAEGAIRERELLCNGKKRYEAVKFRKLILCFCVRERVLVLMSDQ